MKSESWLIAEFAGALMVFCLVSFWKIPVYEKGAYFIISGFAAALSMILGYKFGRSIPQQAGDAQPGQQTKSETTTAVISPSPEPPPAAPEVKK